jgi:hypothetical protein
MLRRVLIGCALIAALVSAPFSVVFGEEGNPFPFATYSDVKPESIQQTMCGEQEIALVFTHENDEGVYFRGISAPDKDIFLRIQNGQVTDVYLTETAPGGRIVVKERLSVGEAQMRFPGGPCAYFAPKADA